MNQLRLSELQNQNIDCIDENNIPTEELSSFELRIITNCTYLEKDNTKYYVYREVIHQLRRNHLEDTILKLDTVTQLTVTAETKLYYGA